MTLERFQFGEFEFDYSARALTHRGREVRLQAQPALLLGVLLARRDQAVSREELKDAIWGNDTHVDFEKGLNFCIGQVRAALRDDASRPVYIRTIPKLGYRFIAPVTVVQSKIETSDATDLIRRSPSLGNRSRMLALGAIGVACVIAAILLWILPRGIPNLAVVRFDAETSTPVARTLADEITDDVMVRLTATSDGHYRVIGNASLLRVPREQRDLRTIASSLHCHYAVLGQVRTDGDRVLVLAHLIRLSDLTHIWVVRFEGTAVDPTRLESQVAGEIASQFATKMSNKPERAVSFSSGSH